MDKLNMNTTQFKTAICNIAKQLKDKKVDYIVTLSKGGLCPARYLAKHLKVEQIHCIGMKFYEDVAQTMKVPQVYQKLTSKYNSDDVVLVVDDIVDSGESIKVAMQEVIENGTKNIVTCSIHYKSKSSYKPDYYYKEVPNDCWVTFDWE